MRRGEAAWSCHCGLALASGTLVTLISSRLITSVPPLTPPASPTFST